MNVEIIAELEINHGASLDIAKQLVFAAAVHCWTDAIAAHLSSQ